MPMIDSYHSFASKAAADLVIPEPGEKAASWVSANLTIMPITIWLHNPAGDTLDGDGRLVKGRQAASGYWLLAATESTGAAATLRGLPSFRLQCTRPEVPTPWRSTITHVNVINPAALTVLGYNIYAGARYQFD